MISSQTIVSLFGPRKTGLKPAPANFGETGSDAKCLISEEGGWAAGGFDAGGDYVILSKKTGRLCVLRSAQLTEGVLRARLGTQYCDKYWSIENPHSKKREFSALTLAEHIRRACDARGEFDFKHLRGPGIYRDGDDLVVNYGTQVRTSQGSACDVMLPPGKGAYQAGPSLGFDAETECASADDVEAFVEAVRSFGLPGRFDAVALVGWWVMAFYGAVLPHRPILAVTAEKGSGKSTLIELFGNLLGPQAIRRDGLPTVAQVIYALESKMAVLLTDEVESDAPKQAVTRFLEMARVGFSNAEVGRQSRVIGQKARLFNAPTGVLVAGTALPEFDSASESRTIRVQLEPLSGDRQHCNPLLDFGKSSEVEELGRRMRRLLIARWPVMRDTLAAASQHLRELGHEPRSADKLAPVVAGYLALTREAAPSGEELAAFVESCGLQEVRRERAPRDCEECLQTILARKVRVYWGRAMGANSSIERIANVIRRIASPNWPEDGRRALSRQLEEFGLRLIPDPSNSQWRLAVCTSKHHEGIKKLLQSTRWGAPGAWKVVLMRIPGAMYEVQRIAGTAERVVVVSLPADFFGEPENAGVLDSAPGAGQLH
jgi:hypothetical protein